MARKPAKELTAEEVLKQQREQQLRFMEDKINNLNEPTYKFEIGDKVTYGAFKECTVTDILYDGKVYGLNCISIEEKYGVQSKEEVYRVATWVDVRPIPTGDSNFSRNNDVRINFINSNIESLLHKYYSFGVNMNPDYQRDYVWKLEDKQLLIDSIFNNIEIGKFAFIHLDDTNWMKTGKSYEILDGKQRLSAIVEFYENRFPYNGVYYNELSKKDRNAFLNRMVVQGEAQEADRKTILKYFLMLNRTGKVMDKKHLEKVEKILEEEN